MNRLYDCFLFNDEVELLEIRLRLLADVVDCFVIVWSKETFSGKPKSHGFPWDNKFIGEQRDKGKLRVIVIDKLQGDGAWGKEHYSRNRICDGLYDASHADVIMMSDVDEIPRPSVVGSIKRRFGFDSKVVLELDYFNFKFNYKLCHGPQAVWPGPVACMYSDFTSPQELRDCRWQAMSDPDLTIRDAGWHFSFLTETDDVSEKLGSFSHQEKDIQNRIDSVNGMLAIREGFHDHFHAGTVWAYVDTSTYRCPELEVLVGAYPTFLEPNIIDDMGEIEYEIKRSMKCVCDTERAKIIRRCTRKELADEISRRVLDRFGRFRNRGK